MVAARGGGRDPNANRNTKTRKTIGLSGREFWNAVVVCLVRLTHATQWEALNMVMHLSCSVQRILWPWILLGTGQRQASISWRA